MAIHGRRTQVLVNQYDLSIYFKNAELNGEAAVLDATTFTAAAKTFIPDFVEGGVSLSGVWSADQFEATNNPAGLDNRVDDVLQPILGVDSDQYFLIGQEGLGTFGLNTQILAGKETKYSVQSPFNGLVSAMAEVKSDGPIQQAILLAHQVARTATGTGTAYDGAAATAFGAKVQIHCTEASAGDTLDVIVEDSADNVSWATIGTFTQLTAVGHQRISIAGTIRRYVRVSWTIAGTGPSFTFVVALARNNS
ncbi:MAG: hypothetical protein V7638_3820 [Acidobacteriota bacterium]|jgi:hypothetical protein